MQNPHRLPIPVSRTILLVEDDDRLRQLCQRLLSQAGYVVLDAALNSHAAKLCGEYKGRIDLLITDVMMPGTTGADLSHRVRAWRPEMRVLFMSGYPHRTLVEDGVLAADDVFLPKPFDGSTLVARVETLLDPPTPAIAPPPDLHAQLAEMQSSLARLTHLVAGLRVTGPQITPVRQRPSIRVPRRPRARRRRCAGFEREE